MGRIAKTPSSRMRMIRARCNPKSLKMSQKVINATWMQLLFVVLDMLMMMMDMMMMTHSLNVVSPSWTCRSTSYSYGIRVNSAMNMN